MNTSTLRVLVRPTLRSLPWALPAASIGFALAFATAAVVRRAPDMFEGIDLIRRAALFAVAGFPILMDDPAAPTIAASPVTMWARRSLRLAASTIAAIVGWGALITLVSLRSTGVLPLWWLLFETLTMMTIGVAAGLVAGGRAGQGGVSGAAALITFSFAMPLVPARWSLTAGAPGDPVWAAAHARWGVVLVASCVMIAALSTDPARRRARPRSGSRRG